MTPTEIRAVFMRRFNNQKNFMTSTVIRYGKKKDLLYELSTGRGFMDSQLFGVTVLTVDGKRTNLSQSFSKKTDAEYYISSLGHLAADEYEVKEY